MSSGKQMNQLLNIDFPLIMAPMFLVSNQQMLVAGIQSGIMATFPSLNFRKKEDLEKLLDELNQTVMNNPGGNYGINLIVQKTNIYFEKHLEICVNKKVPFYITSLGSPARVIEEAHRYGAKVFCDVTNIEHARKCYEKGCDGFIAVGQGAGGHAGPNPLQVLVPALKAHFPDKPVIAAGGITDGHGLLSVQVMGADGISVGTRFIASTECQVNDAYKQAILGAGMDDIVMTTKLSGTPCTIIDTPEAKRLGYTQNWFERFMSNNPRTRKWFKTLVQVNGMKRLENSVLPNNYQRLWCAGKSSEMIESILPCSEIIADMKADYKKAIAEVAAY